MARKQFILALEGVTKTFDGFKAINDLTFYMNEGELRTVIGPNGAGKTTMLDLITGRTRPDRGKIEFGNDTDLTTLNEYQINRLGIGRKFQTPSVYVNHTVFENIWLSLEGSRSVWSCFFARPTSVQRDRIQDVLKTIGLPHKASGKAGALSHGQKQWLEIGMLLAQNPKLLLVDEPAAGMTDEETHKTGELLMSLAANFDALPDHIHDLFVGRIAAQLELSIRSLQELICDIKRALLHPQALAKLDGEPVREFGVADQGD